MKFSKRIVSAGRDAMMERLLLFTVGAVVARIVDGGYHKAGVGQGLRDVIVATEPAAPAVSDQDQRQPVAGDRTSLVPCNVLMNCIESLPSGTGSAPPCAVCHRAARDAWIGIQKLDPQPPPARARSRG